MSRDEQFLLGPKTSSSRCPKPPGSTCTRQLSGFGQVVRLVHEPVGDHQVSVMSEREETGWKRRPDSRSFPCFF